MMRAHLLIWFTLLVACVLMLLPMPMSIAYARPAWVALVLIYWVLQQPNRVSIGTAFIVGLILDVLQGVLFGQNALALMVVALIIYQLHQRIRFYPLLQQALLVLVVITMHQIILLWIGSLTGTRQLHITFLLPALTSAILWSWLFILLRGLSRYYWIY